MEKFDQSLSFKLSDKLNHAMIPDNDLFNVPKQYLLDLEQKDDEFFDQFNKAINDPSLKEADNVYDNEYGRDDSYIGIEVGIPRGPDHELQYAWVKRRAVDEEEKPIGTPNNNPILDLRQYEVEFMDGEVETMTANLIAENILAQVDDEGHRHLMLDEIEDHRVLENAVPKSEGTYTTQQGMKRKKRTTQGWEVLVRWKDGSSNWVTLKDIKDSYPIELVEYAIRNNIHEEPAFAWWVPFVQKKGERLFQKIQLSIGREHISMVWRYLKP